ncbi:GGDEF domain-containing protein [Butyrivibrio sp. VCB2006]|uniref:GGDEF domain-containing protein n=1 Tax=Butyrivibrio sp. VCB2006 TaxID=1280679 RepID=UPI000419FD3B|nr:GGDEF domain-containing protein [Butyrivibrio sp. VCB2006]
MRKTSSFLAVAITLFVLIIGGLTHLFSYSPQYPVARLTDDWTVVYRNDQYINTNLETLSKQVGSTFTKGDSITLNLASPLAFDDIPFPSVVFKSQYCAYEIYLNDVLLEDKNMDYLSGIKFLGISYNFINLPPDSVGKKLTIKLYVTENNTRANLLTPLLGNFDDVYRTVLHDALFPAFTAIFLIVFGFVFLIISLVFYLKTSGVSSQVICSILSTVLGVWMINAYDAIDFYIAPNVATFTEFCALYLMLPLLYMLIYNLHIRRRNSVVVFLGYSSLAFAILFIVLHLTNIVHINHFQYPYYLMSGVGMVILFVYACFDLRYRAKNSSRLILMLGLVVLGLTMLVYVISAIAKLFVDYRQSRLLNMLVPFGCLFFVVTQLLNHFIFMTHMFAQRKEYASLTQIAYEDNLTGIPNRVSCDKRLVEVAKTDSDFCILSLDLNGLKEVNDNSGHPAGDRLLKSFAGALKDVFDGSGEYFRVGGDEFIVLFTNIEKSLLDEMLRTLESKLLKLDEEDPEANHSVSYGYAYRSETKERDTHAVYMLADQRMYEFKRAYYSHMQTR